VPDPKAVTDYTIKTIDVLGLGTGVTFAVLGAVGVGAALSPAALAFLSLGVVDRLLGVAVGLVQSRQRWGAEINAGLLSRLGATAKEKLHQRKLDTPICTNCARNIAPSRSARTKSCSRSSAWIRTPSNTSPR
jgi:hypothetical protein